MTGLLDPEAERELLVTLEVGCQPVDTYADRPQEWLAETTGEYAWATQREIWQSVAEQRATAVLSCNNSGKTWLAARIIVWFVLTYWRTGLRVVTTAPTAAQVQLLLWQEVRDAYTAAKDRGIRVPGRLIGSPYPQWKIGDATVAWGRKPADHQQSAMQGVHARRVLAVIDEAGGISQRIFDAIDKITTNEDARILAIGNPDDPASAFAKITRPGSGWNVIRVDGLRTPNMTREQVESGRFPLLQALMRHEGIPYSREEVPAGIRPYLLSPLWIEERFTRWCGLQPDLIDRVNAEELGQLVADAAGQSQLFTASVRGDFPDAAGDSVIPLGWYRRAVERWKEWETGDRRRRIPAKAEPPGRRIIGVDVATTNGADETAVAPRQGNVVFEVHRYPEGDSHQTARNALKYTHGNPAACVFVVDSIGIGAGVRDVLRNEHHLQAVGFEAYRQSDRTDRFGEFRFRNDRAAAWWRLRELLDPISGANLCLPYDEKLEAELTAPKWWVHTSGKGGVIQIESKDEIRKRLGHSTDTADAVIQSFWVDGLSPSRAAAGPNPPEAIPYAEQPDPARPVKAATPPAQHGAPLGMIAYKLGDGED